MKSKINLRLCIAGSETLLPLFKECLKSYLKYFEIGELFIYTSDNLISEVDEITKGKADEVTIFDIDEFYEANHSKFSDNINDVLNSAKNKEFKEGLSFFYLRMRLIMDYYLINGKKPFIVSDIDIIILDNIKPIVDWIGSDYLLYNASPNDFARYNQIITEKVGGKDFFKKVPQFNCGWMCIPKGVVIDINKACKYMKYEIETPLAEETAIWVVLTKDNIKTKLLSRDLMMIGEPNLKNRTLCHFQPYGISLETLKEWGVLK